MGACVVEPLHPLLWIKSLQGVVRSMAAFEEVDESARLRKMYHLLVLTPAPLQQWFAPDLKEDQFEDMLQRSGREAALSLLAGKEAVCLTVDDGEPLVTAKLALAGSGLWSEIRESSVERAVVGAICDAALSLFERNEAPNEA